MSDNYLYSLLSFQLMSAMLCVRPSLEHVNEPPVRIHRIKTLKLNNFNENQCRLEFHYDTLAMWSKFLAL